MVRRRSARACSLMLLASVPLRLNALLALRHHREHRPVEEPAQQGHEDQEIDDLRNDDEPVNEHLRGP